MLTSFRLLRSPGPPWGAPSRNGASGKELWRGAGVGGMMRWSRSEGRTRYWRAVRMMRSSPIAVKAMASWARELPWRYRVICRCRCMPGWLGARGPTVQHWRWTYSQHVARSLHAAQCVPAFHPATARQCGRHNFWLLGHHRPAGMGSPA